MNRVLQSVFFALLLCLANAGATQPGTRHCQGLRLPVFAVSTETILDQNGLSPGPWVGMRHGPELKYPESSLLRANTYSREVFVPIDGPGAPLEIGEALGMRSADRIAAIERYVSEARSRGAHELPLTDFFPKGVGPTGFVDRDGPNCFNTAARFNNPHLPRREMEPPEKIESLKRDYIQLGPGDKIEFGDELVVWMPPSDPRELPYRVSAIDPGDSLWQGRILHSMIYVDPWTVYHKGSDRKDSPIGFERIDSAMRLFRTWDPIVTVHRKKPAAQPAPEVAGPRILLAR